MANVQNLDINFASADELVRTGITGLDDDRAKELIVYRDENGPFESWNDIMQVPGFNAELTKRMQDAGVTIASLDDKTLDA
jgi:competence protein ComEA